MKKIDFKNISNSKNLRLYILEHNLVIEEMISKAIGSVLNIEWEKSKSFGFTSSSLPFNQKVTLVQDLNDINPVEIKKFGYLMNIRNKFAHIRTVETWSEFFRIAGNANEIKNALEKWYKEKLEPGLNEEELIISFYFKCLCQDLIFRLDHIINKSALNRLNKANEHHLNLAENIELANELRKAPNGKAIIESLEKKLGRKL
jgi:hypothetical protein